MRILIVSTSFPRTPKDSFAPFILQHCKNLRDNGWDVYVLVPHYKGLPINESWDGINITRFRYFIERFQDWPYKGGILPQIGKKPWRWVKLLFYILSMKANTLKIVKTEDIDIVNFHWLFPCSIWLKRIAKKIKIPMVLTGHGTDIRLAGNKFVKRMFSDRAFKAASALTVNSEYMLSVLSRNTLPGNTNVIPMGVDTDKFKPLNSKPSRSKLVIVVGRVLRSKGLFDIVIAMEEVQKHIPEARLEIIGEGPLKNPLKEKIVANRLDNFITLLEPIKNDDLPEKYRSARILALPSLIPEGLGMTAVEAAACGVPTITYGLGGTSEFVTDNQNGLIVRQSHDALVEGLLKLYSNDGLVDYLGNNARARVEANYSWDVISKKFNDLFLGLIKS